MRQSEVTAHARLRAELTPCPPRDPVVRRRRGVSEPAHDALQALKTERSWQAFQGVYPQSDQAADQIDVGHAARGRLRQRALHRPIDLVVDAVLAGTGRSSAHALQNPGDSRESPIECARERGPRGQLDRELY